MQAAFVREAGLPFDRIDMACGDGDDVSAPLYRRVLGDSWSRIAEPLRCAHATCPRVRAHGRFRIEHGRHRVARLLARLLRLPRPVESAETRLVVTARDDGEQWQRTFDGRRLETRQYESDASELAERFGMLELRFRLDACGGSLLYVQREAAFVFGPVRVRIPASWAPRVEGREDPVDPRRVKVGVRVILPGGGLLIAYDGIIDVEDPRA